MTVVLERRVVVEKFFIADKTKRNLMDTFHILIVSDTFHFAIKYNLKRIFYIQRENGEKGKIPHSW